MHKTRGRVQAGLRLLPPPLPSTEGPGGQNPPQQCGWQVDARQHEDLRERDGEEHGLRRPAAGPQRGHSGSLGCPTDVDPQARPDLFPQASLAEEAVGGRRPGVTAERAEEKQKRHLPQEVVPEGLEPFAGGQSGGASGRFLASPAVLPHGMSPSAVAA